jgi:TfoX/Sxy family transcriptional regulator of competence genes
VAYDEELAHRIREQLATELGVAEKRMFGGLGFLVGGNLAVAASGRGGILVRVDPEEAARLVASTPAKVAVLGGRTMRNWLRVSADDVRTARQLSPWVRRGLTYAGSLPPKKAT